MAVAATKTGMRLTLFFRSLAFLAIAIGAFPTALFAQQTPTFVRKFVENTQAPNSVLCERAKPVENKVFWAYGAVYLAKDIEFPDKCVMTKLEADAYQKKLHDEGKVKEVDGIQSYYLQNKASDSLKKVIDELLASVAVNEREMVRFMVPRGCNPNTNKNPLGCDDRRIFNKDWGKRSYDDVLGNWNGRISAAFEILPEDNEAKRLVKIKAVLTANPGVVYSAAIPGASQHLLLAAIDVNSSFCRAASACEKTLMKYGWFRTVRDDKDHFTYLGYEEARLTNLGLVKTVLKTYDKIDYIYYLPGRR